MTLLHAGILGIIEGLTELLPVSSTAHLMIASALLNIQETEFLKTFLIAIQLGAIIAVCLYYVRRIFSSRTLWKKVLVAFVPTAVLGYLLFNIVKNIFLENLIVVGWALVIGGVIMIIIEEYIRKSNRKIAKDFVEVSYWQAFLLGCVQSLALIPGVSRSGATIMGGLLMKIPRTVIVEFSFLLAIPVIAAATGLDLLKANVDQFSTHDITTLLVGAVSAGLVTWGVIVVFMRYIRKHTFIAFGWYRIVLGALVLLVIARM